MAIAGYDYSELACTAETKVSDLFVNEVAFSPWQAPSPMEALLPAAETPLWISGSPFLFVRGSYSEAVEDSESQLFISYFYIE